MMGKKFFHKNPLFVENSTDLLNLAYYNENKKARRFLL